MDAGTVERDGAGEPCTDPRQQVVDRPTDASGGASDAGPDRRGRTGSNNLQKKKKSADPLLDQSDVSRARTFLRIFRRELDALPLPQQFEHRSPHRAAVEEVF